MKDYRLFRLARALSTHAFLLFPALGAVLPKPGFPIHLPVGEKSGLAEYLVSEELPPGAALLPGLVDKKDVEDEEHDWTQKESAD